MTPARLLRENWKPVVLLMVCSFFVLMQNFKGGMVLSDPFHDGEYFAVAASFFSQQPLMFEPLSIHGALDFIPALIARHWWGNEHYFLPTVAIYNALAVMAGALLLFATHELTRNKPFGWVIVLGVAVAAPFFVGYRDLLLLASLCVFLPLARRQLSEPGRIALLVVLGALVGFGMFWSFDRGIATAVFVGPPMLLMAWKNRIHLIAALAFGITVIALGLFFEGYSVNGYLANVSVLLQTSAQWSYGWRTDAVVLTGFVAMINFIAIALAARAYLLKSILQQDLAGFIALVLLSIIMFKVGVNRADVEHIFNGLWAPLLLTLSLPRQALSIRLPILLAPVLVIIAAALSYQNHHVGFLLIACLMVYTCLPHNDQRDVRLSHLMTVPLIALCAAALSYASIKHLREGQYEWVTHIVSPPANSAAVTPGVNWASQRLLLSQTRCVFDLSNNGVINGLLSLPSCSRFTYPVYAARQHEAELIDSIKTAAPAAIVYSSTFPSYTIDGVNMRERFQALDSVLTARYPTEECAEGYCVRYLRKEAL